MNSALPITAILVVSITVGMAYRSFQGFFYATTTQETDPSKNITCTGRHRQHHPYNHYTQIPTPRFAFPIFGHIPFLGSNVALKIHQWHQEYGSLLRLKMGSQDWLLIADPYYAHELFTKHDNEPMTRPYHRFVDEYYSKQRRGLVYSSADDEKYQDFRSAVLQYLSPDSMDEQLIDFEADALIERLQEKANKSSDYCLNPFWDMKLACINVFMSVAFAKRYDSTEDPDFIDSEGILDECFPLLGVAGDPGSFVSLLKWLPWPLTKTPSSMKRAIDRRDAFFKRVIDHGLSETTSHCLVKTLYSIRDKYNFDDDDILVTLSDMNGMSADLPPTSLTWALGILSNHPEVQEHMRQEIMAFHQQHGRLPHYSERQKLPILQSVQKECLRYRCSNNFSVPRQFETDVVCGGIMIPKKTVCVCPFYAMHMNNSFYKHAAVFDPLRFYDPSSSCSILDTITSDVDDRDIFLFGFGPRRCPGIHMVERHMFSIFVRLFYYCRIENPRDVDGTPIKLDLDKSSNYGLMLRPLSFSIRVVNFVPGPSLSAQENISDSLVSDDDDDTSSEESF
ncbi:unnamed protein product [Absidia cylindrospora]